jgi:hypothetical protein
MSNGKKSLTAAVYHLYYANEYLRDFRRDQEAAVNPLDKHKANQWVLKGEYLLNNIYDAMTPESKELYKKEILAGDPIFYGDITEKLQRMSPEQRDFIDLICINVLNGEKIEVQDNSGQQVVVNS